MTSELSFVLAAIDNQISDLKAKRKVHKNRAAAWEERIVDCSTVIDAAVISGTDPEHRRRQYCLLRVLMAREARRADRFCERSRLMAEAATDLLATGSRARQKVKDAIVNRSVLDNDGGEIHVS
jgi:hypothetical protein